MTRLPAVLTLLLAAGPVARATGITSPEPQPQAGQGARADSAWQLRELPPKGSELRWHVTVRLETGRRAPLLGSDESTSGDAERAFAAPPAVYDLQFVERVTPIEHMTLGDSPGALLQYAWDSLKLEHSQAGKVSVQLDMANPTEILEARGFTQAYYAVGFLEAPLRYQLTDRRSVLEIDLPRPLTGFEADKLLEHYRRGMQSRHLFTLTGPAVLKGSEWSAAAHQPTPPWIPVGIIPAEIPATGTVKVDDIVETPSGTIVIAHYDATLKEPYQMPSSGARIEGAITRYEARAQQTMELATGRVREEEIRIELEKTITDRTGETPHTDTVLTRYFLRRVLLQKADSTEASTPEPVR